MRRARGPVRLRGAEGPNSGSFRTRAGPSGLIFNPSPTMVPKVGPGSTASFNFVMNVSSLPYSATFNVNFVDPSSGAVLGTVPFQIDLPSTPFQIDLPSTPPTVVSRQRIGVRMHPTSIIITYSEAMDPATVQNVNNYVL